MSADLGAKTAKPPLVDNDLISGCQGSDDIRSSLLACNIKCIRICENPFLPSYLILSASKNVQFQEEGWHEFIITLRWSETTTTTKDENFKSKIKFSSFI